MLGSRGTKSEVRETHYALLQFSYEKREFQHTGKTSISQAKTLVEESNGQQMQVQALEQLDQLLSQPLASKWPSRTEMT